MEIEINDSEVLDLISQFLYSRKLFRSADALEQEINKPQAYSMRCLPQTLYFLRDFIKKGQWEGVLQYLQVFKQLDDFPIKEALCSLFCQMYCEISIGNIMPESIEKFKNVMDEIKSICSVDEFVKNNFLEYIKNQALKYPNHNDFITATRFDLFSKIHSMLEPLLIKQSQQNTSARLVNLLAKGLLYDHCSMYCCQAATNNNIQPINELGNKILLSEYHSDTYDNNTLGSLYNWIQNLNDVAIFSQPFEDKNVMIIETKIDPSFCANEHATYIAENLGNGDVPCNDETVVIESKEAVPQTTKNEEIDEEQISQRSEREKLLQKVSERLEDGKRIQQELSACKLKHLPRNQDKTSQHEVENSQEQLSKLASPHKQEEKGLENQQEKELPIQQEKELRNQQEKEFRNKQEKELRIQQEKELRNQQEKELRNQQEKELRIQQEKELRNQQEKEFRNKQEKELRNQQERELRNQQEKELRNQQEMELRYQQEMELRNQQEKELRNQQEKELRNQQERKLHNQQEKELRNQQEMELGESSKPAFFPSYFPVEITQDTSAIRAVSFNPKGLVYAVGSNSRTLKLCQVPKKAFHSNKFSAIFQKHAVVGNPHYLSRMNNIHSGSIYALAWNDEGNLLASCSNDKSIKLLQFDDSRSYFCGNTNEILLNHRGIIRDIVFLRGNGSILASGGSVDYYVYTSDCAIGTLLHKLKGHSDQILSLSAWGNGLIASASQDKSVRIWDIRSDRCVSVLGFGEQNVPTSINVNPTGQHLAVGRDDAVISIYDLKAGKTILDYKVHDNEVRSVKFNPTRPNLLLSGSYDNSARVTDTYALMHAPDHHSAVVNNSFKCDYHTDKVIQCRWHPYGYSFASTSADTKCVLWGVENF